MGKPLAILTKDVQLNLQADYENEVYRSPLFRKHILTRPGAKDRYLDYVK